MPTRIYSRFVKRLFDLSLAVSALILFTPILTILAVFIRLKLGSPVFFRQQRPGLRSQPFWLLKFRSMTDARDENGQLLPDSERLPAFGKFLRASSLDEFPELWNVVKGDMSLVGPRPLLMEYLEHYSPEQKRRHEVRPGITGWAQINGRNELDWEQRFALDVWYVDHCSLWLDVSILARTFFKVIRRDGISAEGHATMPKFKGSS